MPGVDTLRRWAFWLLVSTVVGVLSLAIALIPYTQPLADDFCRAILDPFTHLKNLYSYWSGRWFSILSSIEILTRVGIVENYPKLVAALFGLTVSVWGIVVYALVGGRLPIWRVAAFGLLLFVLFWSAMPSPGETIYWAIGGMENHFGLFAAVCSMALMSRLPAAATPLGRGALIMGAIVFAVISTGCHESSALCLSAVVVVACLAAYYTQSDERHVWLLLTLVVLIGAAVTVGAPGNFNRSRFFPEGGDPVRTVQMVAWGMATIVGPWFLDVKFWAASAVFLGMPDFGRLGPRWLRDDMVPWRWVAPGATVMIMVGILLAAGWGSGSPGPERLHNFMFAVFVIGWLVTLFAWSERVSPALSAVLSGPGAVVAMLVLAAGLLTAPNTTNAIHDFARGPQHDVAAWSAAIERRYDFIRQAKADGKPDVVVPAPPVHPWSFAKADLSQVTGSPQNVCPARFFGLTSLGVEPPPLPVEASKRPN